MNASSLFRFFDKVHGSLVHLALLLVMVFSALPLEPAQAQTRRPDLTVSRISAEYPYPGMINTTRVRYTVRNIGTAPAPAFMVTIRDGSGRIIREFTGARLSPGQSRIYYFYVYHCQLNHRVILDRVRLVRELNESNNSRSIVRSC